MTDIGSSIFGDNRSAAAAPDPGARDLVVITWDGSPPPHRLIHFDQPPLFDLLTLDYTGKAPAPAPVAEHHEFRSARAEGKGQCFEIVSHFLDETDATYRYVGVLDDDLILRVSDLNYLLHIASCFDLDSFAPSLGRDGYHSHRHTLARGSRLLHPVPWVEVMMPFYRAELFKAATPYFGLSISSWGLDKYVMPMVQKLAGRERTAVIDGVIATHVRPIRSSKMTFSNGLDAFQEMDQVRVACIREIDNHYPELLVSDWFAEIFDALGPGERIRRKLHTLVARR